jgi:hypothetical protein
MKSLLMLNFNFFLKVLLPLYIVEQFATRFHEIKNKRHKALILSTLYIWGI